MLRPCPDPVLFAPDVPWHGQGRRVVQLHRADNDLRHDQYFREFHDQRIQQLLNKLWQPGANTIVAFDEVGYVESLSGDMRALVQMYWREARSVGITVVAMKQRPQGALRDMHSETYWTAAFAPKDRSDAERFAELFGHRRDWLPVFDSLDPDLHEFILRHSRSREAYISWVDTPLTPQKIKRKGLASIVGR